MNKTNKIVIYASCLAAIAAIILVSVLIIHSFNNTNKKQSLESYGIVKKVNNDSIVVEDPNTNQEKTNLTEDTEVYREGDLIYVQVEDNKIKTHEVVIDNYNSKTNTTTVPTTTIIVDTTTVTSTPQVKTTQAVDKDSEILKYLEGENENIKSLNNSESFKDKAKKVFITIVDFIFYDGQIKGITFKELRASTKAKVIYYALIIDSGIESKFPKYKENIGDKYKDIKAKLTIKFLELKTEVCAKSGDDCETIKNDLAVLKKALNITWDFIKDAFVYIKDLSIPKIKSLYESFRG